ncbi:GRAS family transcription factor [Euphorbia peplus]|nr:GRAS family transcription factor [Euphorbia peplus]
MGTDAGFSHQYTNFTNGYKFSEDRSFAENFNVLDSSVALLEPEPSRSAPSSSMDGDSPSDDNDFSETIFGYINQMLMEEDMEEKPCMFHDPLALQAAEKSLFDLLGEKHDPPSPDQSSSYGDQFLVDSPDDGFSSIFSGYNSNGSSISNCSSNTSSSAEPQWNSELGDLKPSFMLQPLPTDFVFQSTSNSPQQLKSHNGFGSNGNNMVGSFESKIVVPSIFSDRELALQFQRGVEEANKFLPKSSPLVIDLENNAQMNVKDNKLVVKAEMEETEYLVNPFNVKKHEREDDYIGEERSNKQSAVYVDETELAEMFDKMLVCAGERCGPPQCILNFDSQNGSSKTPQPNGQTNGSKSNSGKTRAKRQQANNTEVIDLRTLLISCAQAVSADDRRTAYEQLKQIRQHSSPFGDGSQRLAHCFANGLEARLAGTGTQIYTDLSCEKASAAEVLKAYLAYISACPFNKIAIIFANHQILAASEKATTLHIIDFGILYGFQWPALIFRLSKRPGGPPKLRITGIELPQSGFRPDERVQATGRRLAKYCERHNVPFEYNAIAKKWETIQLDDLKLQRGEVVAVNCLFRFKNLLDETVVVNNPKNTVLNLIRKINPKLFIQSIVNGSYNAPFFITRFREALFHFSALFDAFDTNMSKEEEMRLKFEKEFLGREALNVIACEGSERVERPETYKQWQIRNMRAGLKQVPLSHQLMKKLKGKLKAAYHDDFVVDEDGQWMLQGWKGRIIYASSTWVPA